jgi:hypothetical protein
VFAKENAALVLRLYEEFDKGAVDRLFRRTPKTIGYAAREPRD